MHMLGGRREEEEEKTNRTSLAAPLSHSNFSFLCDVLPKVRRRECGYDKEGSVPNTMLGKIIIIDIDMM